MQILIVNDDGIDSPLLHLLTRLAKPFGDVTVAAPVAQCSAMSQRITVFGELTVKPVKDYPVEGVRAYSVEGTPADCTKIGCYYLTDKTPDIVFSGINYGVNTGYDICYSGTVSAAIEGAMLGIPAIAYSTVPDKGVEVIEAFFPEITRHLIDTPLPKGHIYSVNFPGGSAGNCKGILHDRIPTQHAYYQDYYERTDHADGSFTLRCGPMLAEGADPESDLEAVKNGFISVGILYNPVMHPKTTKDL